jgi:WD40 repeat protein
MINLYKLPMFDVRVMAALVVPVMILASLRESEPLGKLTKLTRLRVVQGKHGVETASFALSPTGDRIATTNTAGRVMLRAAEKGAQSERFLDFPGYAKAVAFSPDGRSLAAVGLAPAICFWDLSLPTAASTRTITLPIRRATRLSFSPDGNSLAVASDLDGSVVLWDLATDRSHLELRHPSPVVSIAFSPEGRWLATGANSRAIFLWDLKTGSRRILLEQAIGPTPALAFSPDGKLLASSSFSDHFARLWNVETGRAFRILAGHSQPVNSIAFSPDGTLVVTACNDGMLRLWTVATGQRLVTFDSEVTCLRTVAFSPDGQTVVLATDDDDDVRLWEIAELL